MTLSLTEDWGNVEGGHTLISSGACFGSVSTGLIHATPGEMKSLRSSADRIADMSLPLLTGKGMIAKVAMGDIIQAQSVCLKTLYRNLTGGGKFRVTYVRGTSHFSCCC